MRLTFGTELDSAYYSIPAGGDGALGSRLVGVSGLVEELEVRLGLSGRLPEEGERRFAFLGVLRRVVIRAGHSGAPPFYDAAFRTSPLAVARDLLRRRDELVAAGFGLGTEEAAPKRLQDFCEVEASLAQDSPVRRGTADRIVTLRRELRNGAKPVCMDRIDVLDARDLLPPGIDMLLECLRETGVEVVFSAPTPGASASTDLGRVQRLLQNQEDRAPDGGPASNPTAGTAAPSPDGSLVVATSLTTYTAFELLARYLRAGGRAPNDGAPATALLVPIAAGYLAECLAADGSPHPGSREDAPGTALSGLALLPLFLWTPIDPERLVRLMYSDASPFPWGFSQALARALEQEPGIDGPKWHRNLDKALAAEQDEGDRVVTSRRYGEFFVDGRYSEHTRAQRDVEVSARHAAELFAEVAGIYRGRGSTLATAAEVVAGNLETVYGDRSIREVELQTVVAEVMGSFGGSRAPAEAGRLPVFDDPAHLAAPVQNMIWAPAVQTASLPAEFWRHEEREWLTDQGIMLPSAATDTERAYASALRAFFLCTESCVFVVPRSHNGEASEEHPIVTAAEAILSTITDHRRVDFLQTLQAGPAWPGDRSRPAHSNSPLTKHLLRRTLPGRAALWEFPAGTVPKPDRTESPTSIATLCAYPYQYLLKYIAKIQRASLGALPAGPLLYGSVLHGLVERYFNDRPYRPGSKAVRGAIEEWLDQNLKSVLGQVGLPLLQPGREGDAATIRRAATNTVRIVLEQLGALGATEVILEATIPAHPGALNLRGRLDLLSIGGKRNAIIDFKWGGRSHREGEVARGADFQLSLYGLLAGGADGEIDVAYLIATDGLLISHPGSSFAGAIVPVGATPTTESIPALLSRIESTVDWRHSQFEAGCIELSQPEAGELEAPPEGVLPRPAEADLFEDYRTLLGWEAV